LEDILAYFVHSAIPVCSTSTLLSAKMDCSSSSGSCHTKMVAYAAGLVIGGVAIGYLIGLKAGASKARINTRIKLDADKVVDSHDLEDIGEKKAYCRCWQSAKFPLCDGSHNAHNKESGDNVGPIILSSSKKSTV